MKSNILQIDIQHRLGQHYSKEEELIKNYKSILLNQKDKIIIDPFIGEGHLIFYYLNLFDIETQKELLLSKKIKGYDLFENNIKFIKTKMKEIYNLSDKLLNELFQVRDSLLITTENNNTKDKDIFILTNPPYLAKNVCKKSYPEDFEKYFSPTSPYSKENDYFEIALKQYSIYNGIWIVPSNLFSSDIMSDIRKKIIFNLESIYIYKKKIFDDTDITVTTFHNNLNNKSNDKKIKFLGKDKNEINDFTLTPNGNLCKEWEVIKTTKNKIKMSQGYTDTKIVKGDEEVILLNTKYKPEIFFITKEDKKKLQSNVLILRTTDTGTEQGKLGLYTIEELYNDKESIGLITKVSSRVYTQLFFTNLSIKEQLKLKDDFNTEINKLRNKYNSIFLTNYKNSSNGEQRKRISFKEVFSLINKIIETKITP